MKKFEVSFPYFLEYPIKIVVKKLGFLGFFGWLFQKFGRRLVTGENIVISERIVEIPSVYMFLGALAKASDKILEIGHVNSSLSLELASLGFKVTAIDIRDYPLSHPNLSNIKGDFLSYSFSEKFNWVVSVSTIEHLGFNKRYGGNQENILGLDKDAFQKIKELLADNGRFVLTVPYAKNERADTWFKTYTRASLNSLLNSFFAIDSSRFFVRLGKHWSENQNLANDPEYPYDGVAIFLLSKK